VSFLENSDQADLRKESLLHQYHYLKRRASANFTYNEAGRRTLTPPDAYLKGAWYPGGFNPCTYQVKTRFHKVCFRNATCTGYCEGSHVMRYGERDIDLQEASDFMGRGNKGGFKPEESPPSSSSSSSSKVEGSIKDEAAAAASEEGNVRVHQRDAELMPLWWGCSR
jgi:hypothetical protein